MDRTIVINIKDKFSYPPEKRVYIGRGSKWGNPFRIGVHGNRKEVIEKYEMWISNQPQLLNNLNSLKGKVLVCHCKPKACHGDVLLKLINGCEKE